MILISLDKQSETILKFRISCSGLNGSRLGGGGSGLKRLSESLTKKTPSKTPRRSPSRLGSRSPSRVGSRSPGREGPGTPGRQRTPAGDRFIPSRTATDFEASHYKLTKEVITSGRIKFPLQYQYGLRVQLRPRRSSCHLPRGNISAS